MKTKRSLLLSKPSASGRPGIWRKYTWLTLISVSIASSWLISNRVHAQGVDWGPGGSEADYERAVKGESTGRVRTDFGS